MSQGGLQPCPILTHSAVSLQEALQGEVPEIRAYKLGKRRWSYNQVELVLCEAGEGGRMLSVKQAVNTGTDNFKEEVRESAVSFQVQLANEYRVQVHAFLCYDAASLVEAGGSQHHSAGGAPGAAGSGGRGASGGGGASGSGQGSGSGAGRSQEEEQYEWTLVDRAACQKGCSGPVLRAIQRFGKLGKRAWGTSPSPDLTDRTNNNMKDPRYFYLSFDEAGTHVGVKSFRLVVAVYDQGGRRRLSTCVSPPIRVLANNDVPTGAAHILLHAQIPSSWEGWVGVPSSTEALPMLTPAANPPRHPHGARAAGSPVARTPAGRPRPTSSADSIDHSHHSSSGGEKRLRGSTLQGAHHHHHPHIKQEDFSQLEGRGGSDRRTRRRLSLGREDPDYVPRRGGAASYADVAPVRQLPPRRPNQMEHQHYDDSTPSGTPTQSLPSPGATNSNTSHQLAGAGGAGVGAHQPQGGASSLLGVFGLHQAQSSLGAQQAQQQLQMQQQAARSMLGPLDMDHYPLGLQGLDADLPLPQFLQSHPLSLGGAAGGTRSPVLSPYRQQQGGSGSPLRTSPDCRPAAAFGQPAQQQQQQQQQAGGFPGLFIGQQQQQAEHGMAGLGLLPGGGRLAVSQAGHQPQIHLNLQQLQIHHQQQPLQQQQQLLQFQQQQQQQQAQLNLSSPHAPQQLLADLPGMAGGGGMGQLGLSQLQLPARSLMLPQGSLDPTSSGDDPITAFLEILMKSQAPGPGSPIVELPNLSPGGSPTKSPLRRHSAGLHLGASLHQAAAAGGGGNPSSLSNATAFLPGLQLPASPLSTQQPPQQAQQAAGGGAGSPAGGVQLQRQLLLASMHPPQLPPHAQLQQHSSRGLAAGVQLQLQQLQQQHQQQQRDQDQITSFGSTFNLFQEGGNAAGKAQLAQQQQHQHAQMAALQHHHQQQQQQQQQAELFFRRGPGLTNLAAEQAMAAPRMSPMQGKMDPSLMGAVGLDPSPAPPLSPPRLLQGSDLSPLRMAHSPNSISTPTPSALDDIFESFQPTLETAAEALMHGESAFAAAGIKQEPGVSSAVS